MHILIAEDDAALARSLARGLREQGYAVDVSPDGASAITQALVADYDVIVLDVMLPARDGLDVARTLRGRGVRTPILMLTARDTVRDKVAGLDAGADDYLTKPFELDELLARLRALLRRGPALGSDTITVRDLVVDVRAQTAARAGRPIPLTAKEFALLECLARNAGRVMGRAEICAHVWDDNHDPFSNAIEVYVGRLRRKVDGAGDVPLLHTRRGAGYVLADLSAESPSGSAAASVPPR